MGWKKIFVSSACVACSLGLYGLQVEGDWVEARHIYIRDATLGRVLKDKVVVHLSDLHIGKIGAVEERILEILGKLKPDIIFLTGDYVQWKGNYKPALEFLAKLKAGDGIWAVMGDYDYNNTRKGCLFCHERGTGIATQRHHVKFLRNSIEEVELDTGSIRIGGLDMQTEPWFFSEEGYKEWGDRQPLIVLNHNPLGIELFSQESNVLVLAGDTHGGQVPLPAWVWRILGYEKNAKYSHGLYEKGKARMFVSKGVGTSYVPVRILRRPEVVVIHFSEKENTGDRSQETECEKSKLRADR